MWWFPPRRDWSNERVQLCRICYHFCFYWKRSFTAGLTDCQHLISIKHFHLTCFAFASLHVAINTWSRRGWLINICSLTMEGNAKKRHVHSCQQKSFSLKFSKSQTRSDVRYSCHHNSSRFTFPIFVHSCRFSVLNSLQSITPHIY